MSTEIPPHELCRTFLEEAFLASQREARKNLGIELQGKVIITTIRVVAPGLSEERWRCPHGTEFWIAPDAEMQRSLGLPAADPPRRRNGTADEGPKDKSR